MHAHKSELAGAPWPRHMHLLGVLLVAGARVQQAQLPRLAGGNNGFPLFFSEVVMQNRQEYPHRACECECWLFGVSFVGSPAHSHSEGTEGLKELN